MPHKDPKARKEYHKKYYEEYGRKWRQTSEFRARYLLSNVQSRKKGHDLDIKWIQERLDIGVCEITGIPFSYEVINGRKPKGASIDRIDSSKGYYKENCQMVLTWINYAKVDMPLEYFKQLLKEIPR